MRSVTKLHHLGQGKKAGHYIGQQDVRCYRPPFSYRTTAGLIDSHPLTQRKFDSSEWWIFLTPDDDYEKS